MEQAAAEAAYDRRHKKAPYHDGTFPDDLAEWSTERTADTPYHYRDGVKFWVADRDLNPHDHFLGGAADCTHCQEVNELGDEA